MSKYTLIAILSLLLTGCSVLNKSTTVNGYFSCAIRNIKENNISAGDFIIIKADIKIIVNKEEQKLLANIKYKYPESYLISIHSITGIEVARGFISKDTILVNDRINKKLYAGPEEYLSGKYGMPFYAIPVIFGDLIDQNKKDDSLIVCNNGYESLIAKMGTKEIKYKISCREKKSLSTEIDDRDSKIIVSYGKFKKYENKIFPTKISIEDKVNETTIEIRLGKINLGNIERLNFIPGKDYETIFLK